MPFLPPNQQRQSTEGTFLQKYLDKKNKLRVTFSNGNILFGCLYIL